MRAARAFSVVASNGRWAGYRALLGARMKELWREPEVIFWVFVFPLLLALGLGIAFATSQPTLRPSRWSTTRTRNR